MTMSSKIFLLLFMLSVGAAADGEPVDNGTGHLPEAATREKRSDDFPASQVVVDDLAQKVNHHEAEITELKTLVNKLQADLGKARTEVGFFAYHLSSRLSVLASGTVIMERTYTNQGSAYDTHSGTFRAPVSGTYAFFVTIRPYTDTPTLVYITLEGSTRATAYASHNYLQATAHVVLHLSAGQRVWLRNGYSVNHDLYGGAYSHFSGFLVQADP
ncbi:hypothetical protein BaRGS_00012888 [Batillaria attramentaria]|uniref:C1q domain-containing protein n=1 Tax=Batillaria attramentaria TaxID=370345 RepID=A0ABD0L9M8_9CAEN